MRYALSAIALTFATAVSSHAQLALYGGFTTSKTNAANTPRLSGGTFGTFYDGKHYPVVNFGIDVRGVVLPVTEAVGVFAFTVGPRAVVHLPGIPVHPYVEITAGAAKVQYGSGGIASYNRVGFAASATAGADLHLLPFLDWRVIDYSFTRLQGPKSNQTSFTTGIVVHIP